MFKKKAQPPLSDGGSGKVDADGPENDVGPSTPPFPTLEKVPKAELTAKQKAYVEKTVTSLYRGVFAKAFEGNSRSACIKAKCLACCNLDRDEITHCMVQICPLWPVRPYQQGEE